MRVDAAKEHYELVEVFGRECLFTSARIDRDTVPKGLYAYDVRHDDDCQGDPCQIKPFVFVNHWGTIICADPIEMSDCKELGEGFACRYLEEGDFNYLGEPETLKGYMSMTA